MGRIHYELGVRTRQRHLALHSTSALWAVAVIMLFSAVGYGVSQYKYGSGDELARRHNRFRNSGTAQAWRTWNLQVRPAEVLIPTAAPSETPETSPVIDQPATETPSDIVDAPAASVDTLTEPTPETPVGITKEPTVTSTPAPITPASEPTVPATTAQPVVVPPIPVVALPSTTVTVDITPVKLPVISLPAPTLAPAPATSDLTNPAKKDVAMQLVSSAENSSLNWKAQFGYIEDIGDGRGYTGGIIGFTSGTHDMLELVQHYAKLKPGNPLAVFIPALQKVDGSESHAGLDTAFTAAWKAAASDPVFQQAQNDERDRVYFSPSVSQAKTDGLQALGQFIYYDAMVMHGPGDDSVSFGGIRAAAMKKAKTPAQGGNETTYLNAFLDARAAAMLTEAAHEDVDRVETEQRMFLKAGNLQLNTPLSWSVYGDAYKIQ